LVQNHPALFAELYGEEKKVAVKEEKKVATKEDKKVVDGGNID
jgi:hypothetical protein